MPGSAHVLFVDGDGPHIPIDGDDLVMGDSLSTVRDTQQGRDTILPCCKCLMGGNTTDISDKTNSPGETG